MNLSHVGSLLLLSTVLVGADCLGVLLDDDDAGDEVLIATDGGGLGLWRTGEAASSAVWTTQITGSNRISMVVDADTVYVGAGDTISAFPLAADTDSQAAIWSWSAPDDVVAMTGPGAGAVFVMTTSSLHALSDADGGELWGLDLLIDLSGVADDAVGFSGSNLILGGDPARRIDPASGAVTHTFVTGSSDVSDLVVDGGTVYLATATGVLALSASTLSQQWVHSTGVAVDAVAVSAASVAFAERGGAVGALARANGNPVFTTTDADVYDALILAGDLIVVARGDGALLAYDEVSGEPPWDPITDFGGPVGGLDHNEQTIFYGHGGVLDGLNVSDGGSVFSLSPSGRPVSVLAL